MSFTWKALGLCIATDSSSNDTADTLYNSGLKHYENGEYEKAAALWKRAAAQGSAEAQYGLGLLHETGNGVYKNEIEALKWYDKAAEQGYVDAEKRADDLVQYLDNPYVRQELFEIGKNYYWGYGVERSYEKALKWLLRAANQGSPGAQYHLGEMCYYGYGVKQDLKAAEKWYRLAASNGHTNAKNKLSNFGTNSEGMARNVSNENIINNNTNNSYMTNKTKVTVISNPQTNVTNNAANYGLQDKYIKAQNSKLLFDNAVELKRKGQYTAALTLYKSAYESYPDDPDVQSTMYAMAKIYLLTGDYEKACALFQDGLTMKLAQTDERTGRFYQKYVMSEFSGGLSESDPDYQWFQKLTADYSIFIGLSHYLLENDGYELLSRYRYDFNNHMQSVAGKPVPQPSVDYLRTCYDYGWSRVIAIASESYNRCFDKIDLGYVQKRKQEFLNIIKTI